MPRRVLIFYSFLGHFFAHLLPSLFYVIVLVIDEGWGSYAQLIALVAPMAFLLGICAPVAGWCGDRWGQEKLLVIFFVGAGAAAIMCGFASSYPMLVLAMAFLGLCGSIFHPVGYALLAQALPSDSKAFGWMGIGGSVGIAGSALLAWPAYRSFFVAGGFYCPRVGLLRRRSLFFSSFALHTGSEPGSSGRPCAKSWLHS